MKESDLNRIINKTFLRECFSHKISDPLGGSGVKNPFDGFSVFKKMPWYWESKLIKEYQALNFRKIEDHQFDSLWKIYSEIMAYCLILVGVYKPRKYFDLFLFDIDTINLAKSVDKKSFLKKELLLLKEKEMYIPMYKDKELKDYTFDCSNIQEKIIMQYHLRKIFSDIYPY
jgi:hypothetical protein